MSVSESGVTGTSYLKIEEISSLPLPSAFQTTKWGTHVPCSLQSPAENANIEAKSLGFVFLLGFHYGTQRCSQRVYENC